MLIVMKTGATQSEIERVIEIVESVGLKAHPMPGANRTAIGITGNTGTVDPSPFADLPGVSECVRVTRPYKLVSRELKPEKTVIRLGDSEIGGEEFAVIGGVCAVEWGGEPFLTAQ